MLYIYIYIYILGHLWWLGGKDSACNERDVSLILRLGRSPGEVNGNSLQYSCLGNPMDREAWWSTVHRGHKRVRHDFLTKCACMHK